jgi:hypothetical protein
MSGNKQNNAVPQAKMDFYNKLIETDPEIELKGATIPYTSYNGNMFSYFEKD